MHLPEPSRADPPVTSSRVLAEVGPSAQRGQAAPGASQDRIGADGRLLAATPALTRDYDGPLPRPGRDDGLDGGRALPSPAGEPELGDRRMGDQAPADIDHLVRAVRPQSGHAVLAHGELDARPPAEARASLGVRVAEQRLDGHLGVEASQPTQLLADYGGLERSLSGQGGVLPVAAAAPAGASVRAGRLDPIG